MAILVFLYGLLFSFVMTTAVRNRRAGVANPLSLDIVGYGLVGITGSFAVCLLCMAAAGMELSALDTLG